MSSDEQRIAEIRKRLERSTQAARDGEVRVWIHADRATWEDRDDIEWLIDQLTAARQRAEDAERERDGLRKELNDERAFCICGCPNAEHEDYGEDGEACEHEDHECLLVCAAAHNIAKALRTRAEAAESARDTLAAKLAGVEREIAGSEDFAWALDRVQRLCASAYADASVYGKKLLKGFGYPNEVFRAAQDARALNIVLAEMERLRAEVEALRSALSPCCPDEEEVWNLTKP